MKSKAVFIHRKMLWGFLSVVTVLSSLNVNGSIVSSSGEQDGLVGKLAIRLVAEKQGYVTGEMIFLEDTLENLTNDSLSIPDPSPWDGLDIYMEDSSGIVIRGLKPILYRIGAPTRIALAPREKNIGVVGLIECGNMDSRTGATRNLKPGNYRVWVELGDVKSNSINLGIDPVPQGEQPVQRLLMEDSDPFSRVSYDVRVNRFEEMFAANQNSVYAPNIYFGLVSMLFVWHRDHGVDKLLRVAREFLTRYPNSGVTKVIIGEYRIGLETSLGMNPARPVDRDTVSTLEGKLLELKVQHEGTRLARYVDEEVVKVRRQWLK